MRRRNFISTLAAAIVVTVLALTASAQQSTTPRRIGVLSWYHAGTDMLAKDFEQRLAELGLIAGRDVVIDYNYAASDTARAEKIAADLIARRVEVIVAQATPAAHVAKKATGTIPIVVHTADALRTGLVQSLARPGGNLTGVSTTSTELSGKRVEFLRELVPGLKSVAFLGSTKDQNGVVFAVETEAAAAKLGLQARRLLVDGPEQFADAFATLAAEKIGGVIVQPIFAAHRLKLAELALQHRLPVASDQQNFAEAGMLFAYGTSRRAIHRKLADHTVKILAGAKPADIPVEQPTEFQLVINAKTAKTLGLTIPPTLLAFATEVLE
jgi:putative tryptophan/tyrosine transport system substrate-binding protein